MGYQYLLVDLDDTLLDYRLAERLSLLETFAAMGKQADEGLCVRYSAINAELWALKEQGVITRSQLRHARFARLLSEAELPVELADEMNRIYSGRLRLHGETVGGARELLQSLHRHMKIAAVTNGVTAVQRSRLNRTDLPQWLDAVIISEEVGLHKPDPAMVFCGLDALHCTDPRRAILLGDSLNADIAAANAAGIDSIWLAPEGGTSHLATYTVPSLPAARQLLERGWERSASPPR